MSGHPVQKKQRPRLQIIIPSNQICNKGYPVCNTSDDELQNRSIYIANDGSNRKSSTHGKNTNKQMNFPHNNHNHGYEPKTIRQYLSNLSPAFGEADNDESMKVGFRPAAVENNPFQYRRIEEAAGRRTKHKSRLLPDTISKFPVDDESVPVKLNRKKVSFSRVEYSNNQMSPSLRKIHQSSNSSSDDDVVDQEEELVRWLRNIDVSNSAISTMLREEVRLNDMLELMSQDDLIGIGLKIGPELRIWNAVQKHRRNRMAGAAFI